MIFAFSLLGQSFEGLARRTTCDDFASVSGYEINNQKFKPAYRFFESDTPIRLNPAKGASAEITFSFDGELPWNELHKVMRGHADAISEWRDVFSQISVMTPERTLTPLPWSVSQWRSFFKLSEKQWNAFVIRPGSKLSGATHINPADLPPREFAFFMDYLHNASMVYTDSKRTAYSNEIVNKLIPKTESVLKTMGLEIKGHLDSGFIEVAHSSFEKSPKKLYSQLVSLYKHFPNATVHTHLGLPASEFTHEQTVSIARAIETKMILSIAAIGDDTGSLAYNSYTSLFQKAMLPDDFRAGTRGVILLKESEWTQPVVMNNLELRQYVSETERDHLVSFSAQLAINRANLVVLKDFRPKEITDAQVLSLNGALAYVSELMKLKNDRSLTPITQEIDELVAQIEKDGRVTQDVRKRTRKLIEKENLLEKLNDSLFLLNL